MATPRELHPVTFFKGDGKKRDSDLYQVNKDFTPTFTPVDAAEAEAKKADDLADERGSDN